MHARHTLRVASTIATAGVAMVILGTTLTAQPEVEFDHRYPGYAELLAQHLVGTRVDYVKLKGNRKALEAEVLRFGRISGEQELAWRLPERLTYWINAYNLFTLQSIVDHYPIQGSWFSLYPRNSIRQIDGVWDERQWNAAGRSLTLDQIEHSIIRPTLKEPRAHFAVNCASVSCPPLRTEPYLAARLDEQLDDSARRFLASDLGLRVDGSTLRVSSIFKWYGDDFIEQYAQSGPSSGTPKDRAILGVVARHGPAGAATLAASGRASLRFLDYDWSLNEVLRP